MMILPRNSTCSHIITGLTNSLQQLCTDKSTSGSPFLQEKQVYGCAICQQRNKDLRQPNDRAVTVSLFM